MNDPDRARRLFAAEQPPDHAATPGARAVMDCKRELGSKNGHTPASDRETQIAHIPGGALNYIVDAIHCLEQARNPEKLKRARFYMSKAGAMAIAAVDRIDHEIAKLEAQQDLDRQFGQKAAA